MPGAVPATSTEALTNATIKQGLAIADKGWVKACNEDQSLKLGLNIINGEVVYEAIADAFDLDYKNVNELI
jgi:alanine dehydrogenase